MIKKYKRPLLAAVLAVAAVLALVGPATASATVWKDGGTTVTKEFSIGVTGPQNYEMENSAGGIQCSEHFTLKFNGVSTTTLGTFENKGCTTFGTYKTCTVQNVEAIGAPWAVTLEPTALKITSFHIKHTFKAGCPKGEINQTLNVTMTPNSTSSITELNTFGTSGTFKQFGTFTVDSPNSGTYGIG
ncbi:MAG TPA: hypothetical protein VGG40_04695 [Solirubrobacterales bacterium]|jgi:hypothetical protein